MGTSTSLAARIARGVSKHSSMFVRGASVLLLHAIFTNSRLLHSSLTGGTK